MQLKLSDNNQDRLALTVVLLALMAIASIAHEYRLLDRIEWAAVDQLFSFRHDSDEPYEFSKEIVPIAIDDQSVDPQFSPAADTWGKGGWFTRDQYITQMQMYKDFYKPAVVAYDLIFPKRNKDYQSGTHPVEQIINLISGAEHLAASKQIQNLQHQGNNRVSGMVTAMDMDADIRTLFAMTFPDRTQRANETLSTDEYDILKDISLPDNTIKSRSKAAPAKIWEMPFEALLDSPAYFAPINLPREIDGTIRRVPLLIPYQKGTDKIHYIPAFTFMSFLLYSGVSPDELNPKGDKLPWIEVIPGKHIELKTVSKHYSIPIDSELKMHLNPRFTYEEIKSILFPYVEVTHLGLGLSSASGEFIGSIRERNPNLTPEYFHNKLLLVYPAATQTLDTGNFSISTQAPNGLAYMIAFENIIKSDHIKRLSASSGFILNMSLLVLLGLPQIIFRAKRIHFWIIAGLIIYGIFCVFAWRSQQLIYPIVTPFIFGFIQVTAEISIRFIREKHEKARINSMFGTYLSPELVEQMVESHEEPQLGGVDMEITAFFSDVQGFSGFSEKLTPKQLVDLMNEYLTAMTDILMDYGCYVDKYIGDAIVGIFNAPIDVKNHALQGCIASMYQHKRLDELRHKWKSEGDKWPPIVSVMQARLGLNTGKATVGNMGSLNRFNYTMMGDTVNLAARCESGAKAYGVYSMITGETKEAASSAGDDCIFRYLDKIVVKGRTLPAEMFEIVCLKDDLNAEIEKCLDVYNTAMKHYLKQDWSKAYDLFETSAKLEPNRQELNDQAPTTPSDVMMQRTVDMKDNPPDADWDGVYVMTTK